MDCVKEIQFPINGSKASIALKRVLKNLKNSTQIPIKKKSFSNNWRKHHGMSMIRKIYR